MTEALEDWQERIRSGLLPLMHPEANRNRARVFVKQLARDVSRGALRDCTGEPLRAHVVEQELRGAFEYAVDHWTTHPESYPGRYREFIPYDFNAEIERITYERIL